MTSFVQNLTSILSFITVLLDLVAVLLILVLATPRKDRGPGEKIVRFFGNHAILFSFIIAASAMLGSLFFSNVAQLEPCTLCWWQRVFLYPQAIILLVALIARKNDAAKYCLALSGVGAIISAYHTYLQLGGASLGDCSATGISCEHVYFMQYGYVTIPTMALTAFVLIILFMLAARSQ
jgi:disulfide bond formation protein DsbB